jgi:catechol 2,3-dioxygenase-like lactoylglutathione lyase family enzyme
MRTLTLSAAACLLISGLVLAQAPAPTPQPGTIPAAGATTGLMHAIHATNQVDKTLAFYTEVFGVGGKVAPFANEAVPILTDSPGVTLRVSMLRLPGNGFNFELTEFSNVARTPAQPEISDPGAPHMKFLVRDIEPVVAAVKKLGGPIITTSKAPVTVTTSLGSVKAIFFRDPDGYIVEAIQAPVLPDAPAQGNVVGAIMGVTIGDLDTSSKFWHDIMGLELKGDRQFSTDKAHLDLMGIAQGGSFRTVTSVIPGSRARIEFTEFKGMPRKPFSLRVPDPGSSGMAINVADIQNLLPRLKAAGVRVISRNQELVNWSPTVRNVFVKDPDGLNLELVGNIAATK